MAHMRRTRKIFVIVGAAIATACVLLGAYMLSTPEVRPGVLFSDRNAVAHETSAPSKQWHVSESVAPSVAASNTQSRPVAVPIAPASSPDQAASDQKARYQVELRGA